MGKIGIAIGIVLVVAAVSEMFLMSTYNGLVSGREAVDKELANIDTQLQRRADLIPNLVQTVSGYMEHEQKLIDSVSASVERLMNTSGISQLAEADDDLSKALSDLFAVVKNYPELSNNQNFIQLQDEIAGSENRVAVARRDYNAAVETYNGHIQRFPGILMAKLLGWERADYFQSNNTEVPHVSF